MWFVCSIADSLEIGNGQFIEISDALKLVKDYERAAIQYYIESQTD